MTAKIPQLINVVCGVHNVTVISSRYPISVVSEKYTRPRFIAVATFVFTCAYISGM